MVGHSERRQGNARAPLDMADLHEVRGPGPHGAAPGLGEVGAVNHEHEPDSHVERLERFLSREAAERTQPTEERRQLGPGIEDERNFRMKSDEVAYAATREMSEAVRFGAAGEGIGDP